MNGVSVQTAHGSFRILDLAPIPFAVLRARFGVRDVDYSVRQPEMTSTELPPQRTLLDEHVKEKGSVGKSGSMFVFSADQTCILKTLRKDEADTLVKVPQLRCVHLPQTSPAH